MTHFLTIDSKIPPYMVFPRFLLDSDLSETTKILYMILLDRTRLSIKNGGWSDNQGHVYIHFTISELADTLHKSEMTIKNSLSALGKAGLIYKTSKTLNVPNAGNNSVFFILPLIIWLMRPISISKTQIDHQRHVPFHRFLNRKIYRPHKLRCSGKSIGISNSQAHYQKITLISNSPICPIGFSAIARCDSGNCSTVSADIYRGNDSSCSKTIIFHQCLVYLLFGEYPVQDLIP